MKNEQKNLVAFATFDFDEPWTLENYYCHWWL